MINYCLISSPFALIVTLSYISSPSLNKNNIEYMLTGSFVSSLQGEPRLTHDIDLVIDISKSEANKMISVFSKDIFYFDEDNIIHAIKD